MPIYEYQCKVCGHAFEKLVRHGQTPDRPECAQCQSAEVERLLSLPGISTAKTRKQSMSEARRRAMANKKEQNHAQAEYERNYIKDHS